MTTRAPVRGTFVDYRLSHNDIDRIHGWVVHPELRSMNTHRAGDLLPLLVVRVWDNEYSGDTKLGVYPHAGAPWDDLIWRTPVSPFGINGQVFLDGDVQMWVTSAPEGDWAGSWSWPETNVGVDQFGQVGVHV